MQKKCRLLEVLCDKFKPKQNEIILSLQYCKLTREQNKMLKNEWATPE